MALNIIIGATGGAILSKKFIKNDVLCALAGFCFAFSPYIMLRMTAHYNLMLIAIVPYYILTLLNAFDLSASRVFSLKIKSRKHLFLFIFCAIIALLSDYIIALTLIFFSAIYFLSYKSSFHLVCWMGIKDWAISILVTHIIRPYMRKN